MVDFAHLWDKLSGRRRARLAAAKVAFAADLGALGPGTVACDLGANVGEFTVPMARTGAIVHAFEPDPHAVEKLRAAVGEMANVTVHQAAVGAEAGEAQLYRHSGFDRDPDRRSKSSSLFGDKANVDPEDAVTIEVIDFAAFLEGLDGSVSLIKMDIEGAEVPLMEHLLAHPVARRIGAIYVETHERKLPSLAARTAALKTFAASCNTPRVNWDWH